MNDKTKMDELLTKAIQIMEQDIIRIQSSAKFKRLSPGMSRDLREYVKVLVLVNKTIKDGRKDVQDDLNNLTDEELKAKAREIL
jgi:ribosome-binding ATPase YchF (GTP1/OBG family)